MKIPDDWELLYTQPHKPYKVYGQTLSAWIIVAKTVERITGRPMHVLQYIGDMEWTFRNHDLTANTINSVLVALNRPELGYGFYCIYESPDRQTGPHGRFVCGFDLEVDN